MFRYLSLAPWGQNVAHVFFMKNSPRYWEQDAFLPSGLKCRLGYFMSLAVPVSYFISCVAWIQLAWSDRGLCIAGDSWKVALRLVGSRTVPALRRGGQLRKPARGQIWGDHWQAQLHHEVRYQKVGALDLETEAKRVLRSAEHYNIMHAA